MAKVIDTAYIVEKLFEALDKGKITAKEWRTATDGLKIISKVI